MDIEKVFNSPIINTPFPNPPFPVLDLHLPWMGPHSLLLDTRRPWKPLWHSFPAEKDPWELPGKRKPAGHQQGHALQIPNWNPPEAVHQLRVSCHKPCYRWGLSIRFKPNLRGLSQSSGVDHEKRHNSFRRDSFAKSVRHNHNAFNQHQSLLEMVGSV